MAGLSNSDLHKTLTFMDFVNCTEIEFHQLLTSFNEIFDYSQSIFWICDQEFNLKGISQLNIDRKAIDEYNRHYHRLDVYWHPRNKNISLSKEKTVLRIFDVISKENYEKTELYNDFLRKYHHYHIMTMYLYNKTNIYGFFTFTRNKNDKPFSSEDMVKMELISKFLSNRIWNSLDLEHLNFINGNLIYQEPNNMIGLLTSKETEVLDLVQKGLSNRQVSNELFISINTVKTHLLNIYRKLEVSNRTELCYKINNI